MEPSHAVSLGCRPKRVVSFAAYIYFTALNQVYHSGIVRAGRSSMSRYVAVPMSAPAQSGGEISGCAAVMDGGPVSSQAILALRAEFGKKSFSIILQASLRADPGVYATGLVTAREAQA